MSNVDVDDIQTDDIDRELASSISSSSPDPIEEIESDDNSSVMMTFIQKITNLTLSSVKQAMLPL